MMFTRFVKPAAFKPTGFSAKIIGQARGLATVEGSAGRTMPVRRPRATPISHDRATFTIRVSLESTIEAWSFGYR
jgi:carbamoyl-phosphate synthase small subunit